MRVLAALREELVPVLIVAVLLLVYAFTILTHGVVPDDLQTLLSMVVAFYFGARTSASGASAVRRIAQSITNGNANGGGDGGRAPD